MTKKSKFYYIRIIAVAMMLQAGLMGIVVNPNGILFAAICKDMGFRVGDLSVYYMIRSLTAAFMVGITTKLVFRYHINIVVGILGSLFALSVAAMACFDSLWQWYLAAVINGIGMSWSTTVIPLVLNNWFKKRNGSIIGITMASSGVVGILYSPALSAFIERAGWRMAALLSGGISFVMIALPSFFFLIADPQKVGLQPYGAEVSSANPSALEESDLKTRSVPPMVFMLSLIVLIGPGTVLQFNNQLPTYANAAGYTLSVGAVLTSLSMIGNLCGKLGVGVMADRFGIYKSGALVTTLIGVSMALLLFRSSLTVMYIGAFLFGLCYSINTTIPSLLYVSLYGRSTYQKIVSRESAINQFIAAFLSAGFPYIYDFTGSFDPIFVYGFVVCILAAFIFLWLGRVPSGKAVHEGT